MAKLRCFLCGGRVSGGVCKECGMPQRQHAQNYNLNESSCDNQPLTHVHSEHDKPKRKNTSSGAKKLTIVVVIIVVIIIAANVINFAALGVNLFNNIARPNTEIHIENMLDGFFEELDIQEDSYSEPTFEDGTLVIDDGMYDYVTYELTDTGVFHDNILHAGNYTVGYHLPEGVYQFAVEEGYGIIQVDDLENAIFIYEYMDEKRSDCVPRIENVHLYDGATLRIDGDIELYVTTDNAGWQVPMEPNPLTETVKVTYDPNQVGMQAGIDFPAGVYDMQLHGDWEYIEIYTVDENGEEMYLDGCLIKGELAEDDGYDDYDDYGDYAYYVSNVKIEEGAYVRMTNPDNVLELVPSEYVVPEEGVKDGEYY